MTLLWIVLLVVALYIRTIKYNYHADDEVLRHQYGYLIPASFDVDKRNIRPKVRVRLWCIANHCVNVAWIYYLWGWQPALLFAVHPSNVEQVCWLTGNYYAGTATLVLAAYWCITHLPYIYGIGAGMAFYTAALNSTLTALGFPFFLLTTGLGGWMFVPMGMYFIGKRFKASISNRKTGITYDKLEIRKIAFMTKIVSRYIGLAILPLKLGVLSPYGLLAARVKERYEGYLKFNKDFWVGMSTCVLALLVGIMVDWKAAIWFFAFILPHSQYRILGQSTVVSRYLYIPLIGVCILLAYLPLQMFWLLVGFFVYRAYLYIPAWKSQLDLRGYESGQYPESQDINASYAGELISQINSDLKNKSWMMPKAQYYLEKALHCKNDVLCFSLCMNLATYFSMWNKLEDSLKWTKMALNNGEVHDNEEFQIKCVHEQIRRIEEKLKQNKKIKYKDNNKY